MRIAIAIFLTLFVVRATFAQTTLPANAEGSLVLDVPAGWVKSSDLSTLAGFRHRPDSTLEFTFHPEGSRPTDLPYALFERIPGPSDRQQRGMHARMDSVAALYRTAIDPPSKADRPGTWKSASVSEPKDFGRYFKFRATINYVGGIDGNTTYYVNVIGYWEEEETTVLSIWTDAAGRTTHAQAIDLMASRGIRENVAPPGPPRMTAQEKLVRFAKISGVLLILFVLGVQIFVLVCERRQRQAEEAAWREPLV